MLAHVVAHTYAVRPDPGSGIPQLTQYDGFLTERPVVDHVVGLSFEYLGEPEPPRLRAGADPGVTPPPWTTYGPSPPPVGIDDAATTWGAGENCTFIVRDGRHEPRLAALGPPGDLVPLPPSLLGDGPWCPDDAAPGPFDADVLRVRQVRIRVRAEAGARAMRGAAWRRCSRAPELPRGPRCCCRITKRCWTSCRGTSRRFDERAVPGSSVDRASARQVAAQEGSALVMALGAMGVIVTLGLAVSLTVSVETDIASNAHAAVQALSLAEAAAETAAAELSALASWDGVLAGAVTAAFFDGTHGRRRAGGADIDLDRETAWLRCGAASCDGRLPDAMTAARPWGRNNPLWTVYASGGASDLLGDDVRALPGYAVVWVGDDPGENDADPRRDGGPPVAEAASLDQPGRRCILLRAIAWGPRGSRRELEIVVERADPAAHAGLRVRIWREVRGAVP